MGGAGPWQVTSMRTTRRREHNTHMVHTRMAPPPVSDRERSAVLGNDVNYGWPRIISVCRRKSLHIRALTMCLRCRVHAAGITITSGHKELQGVYIEDGKANGKKTFRSPTGATLHFDAAASQWKLQANGVEHGSTFLW